MLLRAVGKQMSLSLKKGKKREGKKEDLENYRPVILTSILDKVLEHITAQYICEHLDRDAQ